MEQSLTKMEVLGSRHSESGAINYVDDTMEGCRI